MRFLGAQVILTPAAAKGTGMVAKAKELAEKHGWFFCRQFENEANPDIHSRTTAQEILRDFEGQRLDYWVSGFGTGGTLRGVSRVLNQHRPETRIIACEPDNAPILSSGIAQDYNADGSAASSHPMFRPHLMQGWAPDFIPKLTNDALTAGHVDQVVPIDGKEALRLSRELALKEGIFCGISGGATFAGALQIAQQAEPGSTIVCMIPDTGERYLSTPLFDTISEIMTEGEEEIAASTPGFQIAPAIPAPQAAKSASVEAPEPKPEIVDLLNNIIHDDEEPVVMFALEWCEFSWALRKFFTSHNIPFRSVDLDSVAYQKDNLGGELRIALQKKIGSPTIPQVFVGGQYIGGCTETLDYFKDGQLQPLLTAKNIMFREDVTSDPRSFLPKWVHPR